MNERTIERMNEGEGTMLFAQERECVRACVRACVREGRSLRIL